MSRLRVLVLCLLALPLLAQKPLSETVAVEYVEVPVNVVDRAGNPIRGLTKANFEIYDDKKRIEPSAFDTIDFTSQESMLKNAGNPAAHRTFLVVFDLGYSSPKALERAQEAAKAFINKSLQRGDLVAVATLDVKRGYKLVSNFTSDRAATLAAIHDPARFRALDPLQIGSDASLSKLSVDADMAVADGRGAAALQIMADEMNSVEVSRDAEARNQVLREIDWLSQLAASLRNVRGRKQIVLLTEGFNARLIQGRSARDRNQENEEAAMIISGAWYMAGTAQAIDMDRRYGSNSSISTLQVLKQAFTGSDVTLNAIDIQGVRSQADNVRGELGSTNDGLFLLANPTGGTVFQNSNDLTNDFSRMLHQQELVYILGFQTSVANPGRLHNLKVRLVNVPAGARAVHRLGYFEGGTKFTPTERSVNAADVIARDLPQDGVHLAALAVPFPATGDGAAAKAMVPIVLEIRGADLLKNASGNDIAAELFVYAFDEKGAVLGRIYDRLALDVTTSGEKLRANGVKYIATLPLPPGKVTVKALVRMAANDQMGFVRTDIDVPKPGQLALLPPFVFDDPSAWLIVEGGKGSPYPFHVNGEPFVPSVTGHLGAGMVRKFAVFVANAQPEDLKWETTPPATLLAQVKSPDTTKLILQLDNPTSPFGVTVHRADVVMTASAPIR